MRVLIPDGQSGFALRTLYCLAQSESIQSFVIADTRNPPAKFSRYCSGFRAYDPKAPESWLEAICRTAQDFQIDVVLPTYFNATELVLRNRDTILEHAALPPLPSYEQFMELHDKLRFFEFCQKHNLPTPRTIRIKKDFSSNELRNGNELAKFEFPAVLKPTGRSAGRGIMLVENLVALQALDKEGSLKSNEHYLLQEFIDGTDLSVGVFCDRGTIIASVIQRSLVSVKGGFGQQQAMEFINHEAALQLASCLVAAAQYNGVAYIDMRQIRNDGSLMLIEVNPRFGAAIVGALSAGVNFPVLMCEKAMGIQHLPVRNQQAKYIYPVPYIKYAIGRLLMKSNLHQFRFDESELKFLVADPLPGVIKILRTVKRGDL